MFLKLKGFKDTSIGIDYTNNNIRNLSDIINKVKEYEKEKNYTNIFFVLKNFFNELIFDLYLYLYLFLFNIMISLHL